MFAIANNLKDAVMQPGARKEEYRTHDSCKPKVSPLKATVAQEAVQERKHGKALLSAIYMDQGQLSPKLRNLAIFCLRNAHVIHRMRILELAAQTDNIPSTVVRFAKRYGYRGFHDFKWAFLQESGLAASVQPSLLAQTRPTTQHAAQWELDTASSNAIALKDVVSTTSFQQAVRWTQSASAIGLLPRAAEDRVIALHLELLLMRLNCPVVMLNEQQYLQGGDTAQVDVLFDIDIGLREKSADYGKVLPTAKTKFVRVTAAPTPAFSTHVMAHLGLFSYADFPQHLTLAGIALMNALCASLQA